MLRAFLVRLAVLLASTAPVLAAADDLEVQAALFEMIEAGDVDRVEAHFDELRSRATAGALDPEEERNAYGLFGTTHPEVWAFVARWVEAHPASAHAHTAQGMLYHDLAWTLRGTDLARNTHRAALGAFSELMRRAITHADAALAEDPSLLSATDLMLRLVHWHGSPVRHDLVAQEVMTVRPNADSMLAALSIGSRGWGGDRQQAERLCDWHAAKVADWGAEAVTVCRTWLAATYYPDVLTSEEIAALARLDHPVLDVPRFRALIFMRLEDRPDWAEALRNRVASGPFDPTRRELARHFNGFVSRTYGLAPLQNEERDQHIAWARAREALDPYDPLVVEGLLRQTDVRGEEAARLHAQVLKVRPFDEDVWFAQGRYMAAQEPDTYLNHRGPSKMAISLADQRADLVGRLMLADLKKLMDLEDALQIDIELLPDDLKPQAAKWKAYAEGIDLDEVFVCPVLRAARFVEPMCVDDPNEEICRDEGSALHFGRLERLKADAQSRNACLHARLAPLEELRYTDTEAMAEPGMAELLSGLETASTAFER